MSTFESFGILPDLKDTLAYLKLTTPTPIQEKTIASALEGKDVIGLAQTGTGKTLAFGLPTITRLIENPGQIALVLAPTRELAIQIHEALAKFIHGPTKFPTSVLVGGMPMNMQNRSLALKPRLIIATPGRLMDHLQQGTVDPTRMRIVILDEADRMLDIGFEKQLRKIFGFIPKERQTLLFSATFPKSIEKLAFDFMNKPEKISVGHSKPAQKIDQLFIKTTQQQKNALLIKELKETTGSVVVFARTKRRTDRLARTLNEYGFKAGKIHGDCTQGQRNRVMDEFRRQKLEILVATDIAARGIDIPHIEHVINYDLPDVPEDYVHRIGRTARAGAEGRSVCFVTAEDRDNWIQLTRHLGIRPDAAKFPAQRNDDASYDAPKKAMNAK